MMNIGIYTNLKKDKDFRNTLSIADVLIKNELKVYTSEDLKIQSTKISSVSKIELFKTCKIIIVLGGDGTILNIADLAAKFKNHLLAINLGSRGFLTELALEDFSKFVFQIKTENYYLDNRAMITAQKKGNNTQFLGLNEIVVARGSSTKAGFFNVKVNNSLIDQFIADGVIISTPTGSTAYNLSAGGPILSPDLNAFVITPIAAHSLHTRPLVIDNNNSVQIKINSIQQHAHLTVDGKDVDKLYDNDEVLISKSTKQLYFIRGLNYNYYDRFLNKLLSW